MSAGRRWPRVALAGLAGVVVVWLAYKVTTLRAQPLPVFALGHLVGGLVTATSVLLRDQGGVRGMT